MASNVLINFLGNDAGVSNAVTGIVGKLKGMGGSFGMVAGIAGGALLGIGAALIDVGSKFDDAQDKIRTETGATGKALDSLQGDFKKVITSIPTDFESASTAVAKLNSKLDLTGKPLQTLSEQVIRLSDLTGEDLSGNIDAVTGVMQNWNVPTQMQSAYLDELWRASQASGKGVGELTSEITAAGPQMRALGFDLQTTTGMAGALAKGGLSLSDVMPGLAKATALAAKEGKSATQVFLETFASIKDAPNDTEAAGKALEVFGSKAGPKLSEMIRSGKLDFQAFLAEVQGGSDTILKAGADTDDWKEKLEVLKNKAFVALEPVATKLFDALGKGIDKLTAAWPGFVERFKSGLERIAGWIQMFKDGWQTLVTNFEAGATRVAEVAMTIYNFIKPVLDLLIGLFKGAFDIIWGTVKGAFDIVYGIVTGAFDIIVGIWKTFINLITGNWSGAWNGIKQVVQGVWQIIAGIIAGAWDFIKGLFQGGVNTITSLWDFCWKFVSGLIGGVWSTVSGAVSGGFDMIVGFFRGLPQRLKDAASGLWDFIGDGFKGAVNGVIRGWNALDIALGPWKIPDWIPLVGGKSFGIPDLFPDIPMLAAGGVASNPMLAVIGDTVGDSEIVSPTKLMRQIVREEASGGISIGTVKMLTTANPSDLARQLRWLQIVGNVKPKPKSEDGQ